MTDRASQTKYSPHFGQLSDLIKLSIDNIFERSKVKVQISYLIDFAAQLNFQTS